MSALVVKFLVREGCHLCDDARPEVVEAARRADVGVSELDIDGDDQMVAVYGLRIPVVIAPDGQVLMEGEIQTRALVKAIKTWVKAQPRR